MFLSDEGPTLKTLDVCIPRACIPISVSLSDLAYVFKIIQSFFVEV